MSQPAEIFHQHYQNYLARIDEIDLASVQETLGLVKKDDRFMIPFFNEGDEDFGAYGTVLFQKHAEYYLDPESLAVTSAQLIRRLEQLAF